MDEPFYKLMPGQTLGPHYYVVEFLGGGYEGEVYKVEERHTGIVRAAKLFFPRNHSREAPLLRYARKLYRLRSCPVVIQYHHRGYARIRGTQVDFLVSDFADGEMLSDYLERQRGKRLQPFEALHLLHAIVAGIEPIHYLGEYHGDIHSDNIMVTRHGMGFTVHLLDFFDLGRSTREKIQVDVIDIVLLFHEMIGGVEGYKRAPDNIRSIVLGRRHDLIRQRFKTAGQLRVALENLEW